MKMNINRLGRFGKRLASALLCLVMALSLLPAAAVPAAAADWMEPYLEKLVSWGVMRGDSSGDLHPDRTLTRGEFVVLMNRAFGYQDTSASIPFRDVKASDWYYDDINTGYTVGYFNGTSANTASPTASVTREQAAVLLSRNLVLDNESGINLDFTDVSSMANYSRGLIHSAVLEGIVSGYSDGSFRPKQRITRGQMAVLLVKAVGTPVNKSGVQSLGGVYGNVTISTSGVTLRDTTIAGNLYITGGLGLGDVTLENVTVLGKIVVCGAGESEKGSNSVVLRGVTAPTLILDNLSNNVVSIRAEGSTKIDNMSVRTPSYMEDATEDSYGFVSVKVEGEEGTTLSAAGNLKEIVTVSPKSTVTIAKGSIKSLTVDEKAVGSSVSVLEGAAVQVMNLDTATTVTGTGDVDKMNVNTAGTKVNMLPDTIVIRPGVDASVNGQKMDTVLAAESSADPRLLAGYPKITDLAPTSAKGLMRTNKAGTLYWAVTSVTDGSVGEADLLKPANNAHILKSGNLKAAASNTDYNAAISGLTADGSYYLSAMLVDARDQRSPVKVISFATPDNTSPNFATGFPYMSVITNNSGEVTVMSTKTCRLYYALLPKNATAPTAADFKANAVSGNLGFGSRDVTKNVTDTFRVNQKALNELVSYDLYLWLTDTDGAHSSSVKKVSFTTVDRTPPKFVTDLTPTSIKETSVGGNAVIDEAGTIFWVAVSEGTEYPKPMNGQTTTPDLSGDAAKLQVSNGMNALKSGKVSAAANKDATLTISGLSSETAYDVYYVAQDKAGNFSATVKKLTVHTLDSNPPTVTQEFTRTNDTAGASPLADTDVRIVFSESVQDSGQNQQLLALYQKSKDTALSQADRESAAEILIGLLRSDIQLYSADVTPAALVVDRTSDSVSNWVIDYRNATVTAEEGKIVVTFPRGSALNLKSGAKYYFKIQNIADTSTNKNIIKPNPTTLPAFTTVFAQIQFSSTDTSGVISNVTGSPTVDFDMSFRAVPESTGNAGDGVYWDLLFRMSIPAKFELYEKIGNGVWNKLDQVAEINSTDGTLLGTSYTRNFRTGNSSSSTNAELLKAMDQTRYYGIRFTSVSNVENRETWSGRVEMQVAAIAGSNLSALHNLAVSSIEDSNLTEAIADGLVQVGSPTSYTLKHTFSDTMIPKFAQGYPKFVPSDVSGSINVQLDRTTGRIYYVIAPVDTINTNMTEKLGGSTSLTAANWESLPQTTGNGITPAYSETPTSGNIMTPPYNDASIIKGSTAYYGSNVSISMKGLSPKTQYVAYFVLQGSSSTIYSANAYVFRFETSEVSRPVITLQNQSPSVGVSTSTTALVEFVLMKNGSEGVFRSTKMIDCIAAGTDFTNATMTVLDAMSTNSSTQDGSIFDQYASSESKTRFASLIRQSVPNGDDIAMMGEKNVPADSWQTIACSGMESGFTYTFLCVAKSVGDGGSGDAFRAIRPISPKDSEAPYIVSYSLYPDTAIAKDAKYTGRLSIQFSEPLYYTPNTQGTGSSDQETLPIALCPANALDSTYVSANLVFTGSPGISIEGISATGSKKALSEITFILRDVSGGATIRSSAQGIISDGTNQQSPLSLKFTLVAASDGSGMFVPTITLESASWKNPS